MVRCGSRFVSRALALGALALCLSGCASSQPIATGTVTFNGEVVDGGAIVFVPENGSTRKAAQIRDGKFTIPVESGMSPGKYRVEILWNKKTGKQIPVPGDAGQKTEEMIQVIPDKFNAHSTLQEEVKGGSNTFTFDLQGKPNPAGRRTRSS
jgi:hypothetical protein